LHRAFGLAGHDWQSLYHFTIGGPVEDLRLRTVPPYVAARQAMCPVSRTQAVRRPLGPANLILFRCE
jgi:hypothetical protein